MLRLLGVLFSKTKMLSSSDIWERSASFILLFERSFNKLDTFSEGKSF